MHSLRTRITLVTVCLIVIAVGIVTTLGVLFIRKSERQETDQLLLLLCETGERNLDYYFNSVQKSVGKVSTFVEEDIDGLERDKLEHHVNRVRSYFEQLAYKTNGVLTYYYRIDPAVCDTVKGFWYTNTSGDGFEEHEPTDIKRYDTEDTTALVWFTVPKHTGEPIWLPPYVTDNLDMRVISYNIPIYYKGVFVGVVGIEIDYTTMAEQVDSIRLYSNGYAFLSDGAGALFYHPRIDVTKLTPDQFPEIPEDLFSSDTFIRYTFDGVEKRGAWLSLSNGMRLVVTIPVDETDGDWQALIREIVIASLGVLLVLSLFTMYYTSRITKPLEALTSAAEKVDRGNYDFTLEYCEDDEMGRLTSTFKRLSDHMKDHISDLNKRVYVDALTSVKNKGAFTTAVDGIQSQMDSGVDDVDFAIGMFDCNDLKRINDEFGHDRGDTYLKAACRLICRIFQHSPVFRIGGDEFAVILRNSDFENRQQLVNEFEASMKANNASVNNRWEEIHIAMGIAEYDPDLDQSALDVVRRADGIMYSNKRNQKEQNA